MYASASKTKNVTVFSRLSGEKILYGFVKYRIHISILFSSVVYSLYKYFLPIPIQWPVLIAFSIWHFALYIFDRAYDGEKDMLTQPNEAILKSEKPFFLWLSVFLCVPPFIILWMNRFPVLPYLILLPVTFLYTYPVFGKKRFKDFLFIKNLYSAALIWALPLFVIVYFYSGVEIDWYAFVKDQILVLFIYVLIGEAFWDIRDTDGDRVNSVKTIPVVFGIYTTKAYLYALLLCDLYTQNWHPSEPLLIYVVLIAFVKKDSPRWIFHLPPLISLFRWIQSLIT